MANKESTLINPGTSRNDQRHGPNCLLLATAFSPCTLIDNGMAEKGQGEGSSFPSLNHLPSTIEGNKHHWLAVALPPAHGDKSPITYHRPRIIIRRKTRSKKQLRHIRQQIADGALSPLAFPSSQHEHRHTVPTPVVSADGRRREVALREDGVEDSVDGAAD